MGSGTIGSWAGPDGNWGAALMIPNSSTLNRTFMGSGCFGPDLFYGAGTPRESRLDTCVWWARHSVRQRA